MHVGKAHAVLLKLVASAPGNLGTFVIASVLLDELEKDNADIEPGQRVNGTVREKLASARGWIEILCGVGEDGAWPDKDLRQFIRQALSVIDDNIERTPPTAHFKRWPAVENTKH
jgi:hypothetical protein